MLLLGAFQKFLWLSNSLKFIIAWEILGSASHNKILELALARKLDCLFKNAITEKFIGNY